MIGEQLPNIDIALLENGQYDNDWRHIHILPQEHPKIMEELSASIYLTFHNSKFALAKHDWDEPIITAQQLGITLPKIGEVLYLP